MNDINTICKKLVETCHMMNTDIRETYDKEDWKTMQNNQRSHMRSMVVTEWPGSLEQTIRS